MFGTARQKALGIPRSTVTCQLSISLSIERTSGGTGVGWDRVSVSHQCVATCVFWVNAESDLTTVLSLDTVAKVSEHINASHHLPSWQTPKSPRKAALWVNTSFLPEKSLWHCASWEGWIPRVSQTWNKWSSLSQLKFRFGYVGKRSTQERWH